MARHDVRARRHLESLFDSHAPISQPAAGIYPIDAACNIIKAETWGHPFPPPDRFDIEAEVAFIDQMCAEGRVAAIGECGLDAYYCTDEESLKEQERVLRLLIEGAWVGWRGMGLMISACVLPYCSNLMRLQFTHKTIHTPHGTQVAKKHDLPLILHTRKAEARTFELLQEMGVTKADFHCFCGKAKLGKKAREACVDGLVDIIQCLAQTLRLPLFSW